MPNKQQRINKTTDDILTKVKDEHESELITSFKESSQDNSVNLTNLNEYKGLILFIRRTSISTVELYETATFQQSVFLKVKDFFSSGETVYTENNIKNYVMNGLNNKIDIIINSLNNTKFNNNDELKAFINQNKDKISVHMVILLTSLEFLQHANFIQKNVFKENIRSNIDLLLKYISKFDKYVDFTTVSDKYLGGKGIVEYVNDRNSNQKICYEFLILMSKVCMSILPMIAISSILSSINYFVGYIFGGGTVNPNEGIRTKLFQEFWYQQGANDCAALFNSSYDATNNTNDANYTADYL